MRRFVIPLLLVGACACAQAQHVKVYPRIETGTHTAMVRHIDVDAAERFLFSVSDDKTARVWDLYSGKLLKILRPPIGDGNEGKLYAIASSPSGAEVAVGGFTGANGSGEYPVYIFDRESGNIRKAIRGLPSSANHLAYSKDGRYLGVALAGQYGIRVFKADDYSEVFKDPQYGDSSYWLDFDKSGRVVTASYDGFVRLYSSDFRLLHKEKPPSGKWPYSARFSPDGKRIAVGFYEMTAVDVLAGDDLSFLYTPQVTPQAGKYLSSVLWSEDGRVVCAAGTYQSDGVRSIVCWSDAGKGKLSTYPAASDVIPDIRALKDGAIAFCSGDESVGILLRTRSWRVEPDLLDYRVVAYPRVSSDGNIVEVDPLFLHGATFTDRKLSFSVSEEKLEVGDEANVSLQGPGTSGIAVDAWSHGSDRPTLDGHALPLEPYEQSFSLAISPNKDSFVLGTGWYIRKFDRQGKQIWDTSVPDVAWGVNISADGRFVIAALGDGTVRWYTFDKGEEVLALFVDRDLQRWVAWNPDGFFTFKNGGDALIGYQINHGTDQAGEFVKVDQLREVFYRADLIDQILKPDGATKVLAARNRVGDISQVLAGGLPPEIEVVSARPADNPDQYLVQFRVKDLGGGRGRIVYRIDGVEIEGRDAVDIAGTGGDTINRYIPVGGGGHTLTVAAYSANGKVLGQARTIQLTGRQVTQGSKTSLYVIAAGITHYRDHSLWDGVKFASADADLVAAKFKEQEGKGLYAKVTTVPLEDSRATATGLQDAVAQAAKAVHAGDTFVLYLAGHGMADEGDYYFIPWEAEYTNQADLLSKSLNREAIQKLLKQIPTNKSVLILDTCNAGAFMEGRDAASEKAAIEKVATMSGRAVLAASNSKEMAMDGYKGHGVFTFALLQGLENATPDPEGDILITRLAEYVQSHVPDMTEEKWHYRQRPLSKMEGEPFPIAQKVAH